MKASVFQGGGRLDAGEWPRPTIGPGELLVRVRGCGLCGSDIAKIVDPATRAPAVFGHEVVGDVAEAGDGVAGFARGDRVVVAHHVPCGDCHYCRRGSESMCREFKRSHLDPGGFAEYVRVPAPNVRAATFRVPDHLSDEEASFVEPLACCLRAVERARVEPGDTAVVVGLGSIGCLLVQLLRRAGAAVIGVDQDAGRVAFARGLGVDATAPAEAAGLVRRLSGGRGADHVVITGGGATVLPWSVESLRDGGAVHYFAGGGGDALPVSLAALYHRELTVTATYSSSPATLSRAFWLIAAGKVEVAGLVTHRL
ncbi:MAG TPA: alcohol dehydrogenase catalytic domain-containing protein, partial [Methylomirabilota bacterium]|nr:alcohol dehydrogenase catalytic domain-containing protein [Methylomirabilota bacterium]